MMMESDGLEFSTNIFTNKYYHLRAVGVDSKKHGYTVSTKNNFGNVIISLNFSLHWTKNNHAREINYTITQNLLN